MNQEIENCPAASRLIKDAHDLHSDTQLAEGKVVAARECLAGALENAKKTWVATQEKAVSAARTSDQVIRAHPYQSIGVALGVGALLGYLLARRDN